MIHLIWDESPLSFLNLCTILSLREYNPGVGIVIHRLSGTLRPTWKSGEHRLKYTGKDHWLDIPKDVHVVKLEIKDGNNSVHKSDIARIQILEREGGYYSDFDIVYVKPLVEFNADFAIGYQGLPNGNSYFPFGFMYGKRECKTLHYISSFKQNDRLSYQSYGVELLRVIFQFDNLSLEDASTKLGEITGDSVECFDPKLYLPYTDLTNDLFFVGKSLKALPEVTIGVHWFNGDPRAKLYQNLMSDHIVPSCPITELIERYL